MEKSPVMIIEGSHEGKGKPCTALASRRSVGESHLPLVALFSRPMHSNPHTPTSFRLSRFPRQNRCWQKKKTADREVKKVWRRSQNGWREIKTAGWRVKTWVSREKSVSKSAIFLSDRFLSVSSKNIGRIWAFQSFWPTRTIWVWELSVPERRLAFSDRLSRLNKSKNDTHA